MEIVVKSRHCTPSEHFRDVAQEKLAKLDRFGHPILRTDVELSRENAPRQASVCERVELTLSGKGPVVRAEARAADPVAALDMAISKVEARLRKLAGRRKSAHDHGSNRPVASVRHGVPAATPDLPSPPPAHAVDGAPLGSVVTPAPAASTAVVDPAADATRTWAESGDHTTEADGPFIVREKVHSAQPMTRDQALEQIELVGHDFFLYVCSASGMPSVVYRRRAYDYGVLHLAVQS